MCKYDLFFTKHLTNTSCKSCCGVFIVCKCVDSLNSCKTFLEYLETCVIHVSLWSSCTRFISAFCNALMAPILTILIVREVPLYKTTEKLKHLHFSGLYFLSRHWAYSLVRFSHKSFLVMIQNTSWFWLFWSPQTWRKNSQFVCKNEVRNLPGFYLKDIRRCDTYKCWNADLNCSHLFGGLFSL